MSLARTLSDLGVPDAEAHFADGWDEALARMPDPVPFLQPDYVDWAIEQAHLPPDMAEAVRAAARRIAADPAAVALAWYCHTLLFDGSARPPTHEWPLLPALGEDDGMFYVLVLFSGTPRMLEIHRARGIPAEVTRETALDLRLQLETQDYTEERGRWGISPGILGWLMWHWRGELVRLGRLQFALSTYRARLRAFRHRRTGAVVALSEPGMRYRRDGQVDGSAGIHDAEGGWEATLELGRMRVPCASRAARGYAISPWGSALPEPVSLSEEEWQPALAPGDPILDIHIPTGSPMDFDQCGESIRRALDFFPRHFPERPFAGFACHSWILDNQFEVLLPPASNLVRFQREVYLFPIPQGGGLIRRVFGYGYSEADVARLPRRTGMQRAFAAHLEAGGHFRGGGCFLLKDDVHWGSAYYRTRWPF